MSQMPKTTSQATVGAILLILVLSATSAESAGRDQPVPRRPLRDAPAEPDAPTGTSTISGLVVAAGTGQPVRRAYVRVTGQELPGGRAALTDADGRYALKELSAGRYTIRVSKPGFVTVSFGQRRPLQPGTPVEIGAGQTLDDIDVQLPRGSVITGQLIDEEGVPLPSVVVQVLRHQYRRGERQLVVAGTDQSDDRGQFRVFGLAPGTYYVSAVARLPGDLGRRFRRRFGAGNVIEETTGYAPTYYPGVPNRNEATPVTVGVGQEMTNVNFAVLLVPTARVTGFVMGPDGQAATRSSVVLLPDDGAGFLPATTLDGRTNRDGSFTVVNVPPGRYLAFARSGGRGSRAQLFATQTITVSGQELNGLTMLLMPGADLSGTVIFETSASLPPDDVTRVRVTTQSQRSLPFAGNSSARAKSDGTFELRNVQVGASVLRADAPEPWLLKAVYIDGQDVIDTPLEFPGGQTIEDVTLVLTDRVSELSGIVRDRQGQPLTEFTVIAFPVESALWRPQSRQIGVGQPDQNGRYQIRGLPPGEYYLVAVDGAEQAAWYDSLFLGSLRQSATTFHLTEGDVQSFDLELDTSRP